MALGIIVCGIGGRMGGAVVRAIQQAPDLELVAAVDKPGSARIGKDAGAVAGALGLLCADLDPGEDDDLDSAGLGPLPGRTAADEPAHCGDGQRRETVPAG